MECKEGFTPEEHLAFVEDMLEYHRQWTNRKRYTEEGKNRLDAYIGYWNRYWEGLSDKDWGTVREVVPAGPRPSPTSMADVKKECAAFRRFAARKRDLK